MKFSDVDEMLVQLYLRLNGYFTTGLILHSPNWGQNKTEVDCLAIRHPFHSQPDRIIESSKFLKLNEHNIDLLICEVKYDPNILLFNKQLYDDTKPLENLFRWVGLFEENEIIEVANKLYPLLKDNSSKKDMSEGFVYKNVRIRPILCCPSVLRLNEDKWYLTGSEIIQFVNKCLLPESKRDTCSTRYNFQQWGFQFNRLVKYLKNNTKEENFNLSNLYKFMTST